MTLSVVFSTDENYLFYTAVAIASMAKAAEEGTFYKVYILCDQELRDDEGMLCCLQHIFSNIAIYKISVDRNLFGNVFINNAHISKAAFYRLIVSDIIEEDKCIYLDADTLVLEDLSALWEINVDTCYIAGCRDIWIDWLDPVEKEQRRQKSKIVSLDRYVNSGVLLFNLKKIREDKLDAAFKEHLSYDYPFEDQDILNVCCYDHIMFLPTKWNRFSEVYGSWEIMHRWKIPMDSFLGQGGIIHFTNKAGRPWETYRAWKCDRWWEVADLFHDTDIYRRVKCNVAEKDMECDFIKLCDNLKNYSHVVIWGYTLQNRQLCEWIANSITKMLIFFADRDVNKQGNCYRGAKVLSPAEAYEIMDDCVYIVSNMRRQKEICDDLIAHGILRDNLLLFKYKTKEYYRMVDQQYYEEELQEICMKEGIPCDSMTDDRQKSIGKDLQEKYYMSSWLLKG